MTPVDHRMEAFRGTVGISGPVCVRGGGTRWGLGGGAAGAREVSAPLVNELALTETNQCLYQ